MVEITQSHFKSQWYHAILVRYLIFIIIAIAVIAFVAEYFFIILPNVRQARDGGPLDIATYEQIYEEQQQYLEQLEKLQVQADTINRSEFEKLNFVVATRPDMAAVLSQLEYLSRQTEMELIGLGVNIKEDEGGGSGTIQMSLSFTGGEYRTVKNYLSDIEKNIRVMDVDDLTIREVGNLFSLNIKSYYIE